LFDFLNKFRVKEKAFWGLPRAYFFFPAIGLALPLRVRAFV